MNNSDTEKVIREYRITVIIMSSLIVLSMTVFAFVLLKSVPDILTKQRQEQSPALIKQALNEVLDERLTPSI